MSADLGDVQRIVLHGSVWPVSRTLLVNFRNGASRHVLHQILALISCAGDPKPRLQLSVGFTRRGLEHLGVPRHVMTRLALKAPAFWAGAPLRAAAHLGLSGASAPERWESAFALEALHMVVSLHGQDEAEVREAVRTLRICLWRQGMRQHRLPVARPLPKPSKEIGPSGSQALWVHFGYRDGLSRIEIEGWSRPGAPPCRSQSRHRPGEFVLGHPNDTGADPWVAGPGLRVWPKPVRSFFRNASFGVLQQLEQDVDAFDEFARVAADQLPSGSPEERLRRVLGKLCGRFPNGVPLAAPQQAPTDDFDYGDDPEGLRCPFGSHVRRMNPRLSPADLASAEKPAHFLRARPLLRRGLPYGKARWDPTADLDASPSGRGLIGHFFCASIEDQFEHLLGEWADRVPLGSPDRGGARDPFLGAHEARDGPFDLPQAPGSRPKQLHFSQPFVRTRGLAYLFYPSKDVLKGIADSALWREDDEDDR
jgi:deferrochelatase/peroxidase EfeB